MGIVILSLLAFCFSISGRTVVSNPSHHHHHPLKYESIYSFGDPLSDTGNFLLSGAAAYPPVKSLPYGKTFFGKATGRFSDGRLVIDFLAEASGLPFIPPYRSLVEDEQSEQGVNFAVAGATALDAKYYYDRGLGQSLWTNDSLNVQLGWFKQLKSKLCNNKLDCGHCFKKSLFLVGEIGVNDFNFPFFAGQTIAQLKPTVPLVVEAIVKATSVLIEEGATELMVPGNIPFGCFSIYLTMFQTTNQEAYDRHGCLKSYNSLAKYFNARLVPALEKLRLKYPHARIIYADLYGSFKRLINEPLHYGFTNGGLRACCGAGGPYNFNITAMCGFPGSSSCDNPSSYVSWDGLHLTEAAYRYIAMGLIDGSFTSPPLAFSPV